MHNYFNGRGTFGFTCDVCGRELNSCSIVNGMKFCAKCYQETFGKDNQQNEIQLLKQQLEEKDKEIKRVTKIDNKTFLFETYEKPLREQIQLLKQQLVEKQNKIDEISKEFVQAVHAVYDWRVLCAEKDKEIKKLNWQLKEKAIVVPVKLGDTIYVIPSETNYRLNIVNRREDRNKVYKYLVDEIRYNKYGFSIVCDVGDVQFYCNYEPPKNLCGHFDTEKYYGETWFTTEQEAQEKLKEMKRNG